MLEDFGQVSQIASDMSHQKLLGAGCDHSICDYMVQGYPHKSLLGVPDHTTIQQTDTALGTHGHGHL
jgi:hypothetical protein